MAYTVISGDTIEKIAKKMNISLTDIIWANPQISNPNRIQVGDIIYMPGEQKPLSPALSDWCSFVLNNTGNRVPEPGVSLVYFPEKRHVFVATMGMPSPSQFGSQFNVYTAWIASRVTPLSVKDYFDLLPTVEEGFWTNHKDIPSLEPTDFILVTPEVKGHGPQPQASPTVVLSGNLTACCRKGQ